MRPFALDFCPQRCRTRRISKITCVWLTETVTNRCYVNRQINVSCIINKYQTVVYQFWLNDWQTDAISDWPIADNVRHFTARSFSLLQQLCTVDNGISYVDDVNVYLSLKFNNKYFTTQTGAYFNRVFWVAKSYMAVCFNYFLSVAIFLNIDISQGSVVLNQHAQPLEKKAAFSNFTWNFGKLIIIVIITIIYLPLIMDTVRMKHNAKHTGGFACCCCVYDSYHHTLGLYQ